MDVYTVIWIVLLSIGVGTEITALLNKDKGDTLSEHIWKWFKVNDPQSPSRRRRVLLLGVFMAWLGIHFVSGGYI